MTTTTAPRNAWQHTAPGVFTGPDGWTIVNTQSVGYPWIVVRPDGTPVGPGRGYGYLSAEKAQWVAENEIPAARPVEAQLPAVPTPGTTARFDLANGDSYIGEIVESGGNLVVLRNYAAWYADTAEPFNSNYDDEVRFAIDGHTKVSIF